MALTAATSSFGLHYFHVMPKPDLQILRYHVGVDLVPNAARKRKRAFELLLDTAPSLAAVRPAVTTDNRSMLVTIQKLDLGAEERRSEQPFRSSATRLKRQARSPNSQPCIPSRSHIATLLDYISSTDGSARYLDKESVLQALNIAMSRKPSNSPDIAVSVSLKIIQHESVRLHMDFAELDSQSLDGRLLVSLHAYTTSNSAVKHWDFSPAAGVRTAND